MPHPSHPLLAPRRRRPRAYRPLAPLLRLLLLCYAFGFPVYASLPAAATFTPPAPSRLPLLGPLIDGYHLWMSELQAARPSLVGTAAGQAIS